MKKCVIVMAVMLLLCSCTRIEDIEIPEMTPTPTKETIEQIVPEPSASAEPDITSIDVPDTLEELSKTIGMEVFLPKTAPKGYEITEIGYDGGVTAALKYKSDDSTLLYTFCPIKSDIPENGSSIQAFGLETYYLKTDMSSMIQWFRGGNTYQIIAEPAISEEELKNFMDIMLLGPDIADEESYIDCASVAKLNEVLGFSMKEPSYLPDNTKLSEIQCFKLYTGVIKYLSEYDMLTFRMCEGDITPAFDEEKYKESSLKKVGNITVEYYTDSKGKVILAEWYAGGYTHQIFSESGVKQDTMEMMIVGFSN